MVGDRSKFTTLDGTALELQDNQFPDIQLRPGWSWCGEWSIDKDGIADSDGWLYGKFFADAGGEKTKLSVTRWRRWVRVRTIDKELFLKQQRDALVRRQILL
jgi:hypothetical protein